MQNLYPFTRFQSDLLKRLLRANSRRTKSAMVNSGVDDLYEPVEPYDFGELEVGDGQTLYWETVGTSQGLPAVGLHRGPGSGTTPDARRHFDPSVYRAVLFVALCANLLHSSMNTRAELRSTIRCRSPRRDQVSGPLLLLAALKTCGWRAPE
jgi:hypothetical protein